VKKVKVCVVGVGNQGLAHVKALIGMEEAELVAVADLDYGKAKIVAREHGIPRAYGSIEEVVEDSEIEAVIIATPDHAHRDPVIASLKGGKHVLVEKPMATRLRDAEEMAAEAKRRGLILSVNFENRFNPPFAHVKKLLERGEIGDPLHAYLRLNDTIYVPRQMLSWASKTNVAFFLMSHTVDLACWYFDDEVVEVYATSISHVLSDLGTPDAYAAILRFRDGGFALLESSWVLPNSSPSIFDFKLELICSKGAVYVDTQRESMTVSGDSFSYPHLAKLYELHGNIVGFLRSADKHFIESVMGRVEPLVGVEEGVRNVRILEAIIKSSRERRPVRL